MNLQVGTEILKDPPQALAYAETAASVVALRTLGRCRLAPGPHWYLCEQALRGQTKTNACFGAASFCIQGCSRFRVDFGPCTSSVLGHSCISKLRIKNSRREIGLIMCRHHSMSVIDLGIFPRFREPSVQRRGMAEPSLAHVLQAPKSQLYIRPSPSKGMAPCTGDVRCMNHAQPLYRDPYIVSNTI